MTGDSGRTAHSVGEILRGWGPEYSRTHAMTHQQRRVMQRLAACRTAALGGHLEKCDQCGHERPAYDSCGDRHCPTCQGKLARQWLAERLEDVLNTPYFHCIFTIPEQFNCIVTGGGLSFDRARWVSTGPNFLFDVFELSRDFRTRFCRLLRQARLRFEGEAAGLADAAAFNALVDAQEKRDWVVHSKKPVRGPRQVLEYISRYTYRVSGPPTGDLHPIYNAPMLGAHQRVHAPASPPRMTRNVLPTNNLVLDNADAGNTLSL